MPSAATLKGLAQAELVQLREEGCSVDDLQALYDDAIAHPAEAMKARLKQFFAEAAARKPEACFPYVEPSDLEGIRAARSTGPRKLSVSAAQARDRIEGAWLGRTAGCMLGKPVEGWKRSEIEALLRHAGEYPLADYFPLVEDAPEGMRTFGPGAKSCLRGHIRRGERDDDTDYTLLGLHVMETYGPDFTPAQVAAEWLGRLPFHRVYTAEREAYRNLVNDVMPPDSATHMNPYREWIGAQIRCDGFAYCAPGWPEKAAEFAWRDATVSHTKNGIYGEMFFAALIAACMATDDLHEAIAVAQAEVPENSRFAEVVRDTVAWCAEDAQWETTWERVMAKYGHYHPVHTLNNAALVLVGCLHAKGDLGQALCIAVMGGLDTDCNGATAGSVMGALLGASGVPAKWTAPLQDELHSALEGMNVNRISDLAQRTSKVAERVLGA